jgi:hypothetical protein
MFRVCLLPFLLLSCAFYLTHIYRKALLFTVLIPRLLAWIRQTRTFGRSLRVLATLLVNFHPVLSLCRYSTDSSTPSRSLSFSPSTALVRPLLVNVLSLRSVCLYGPPVSRLKLCASNKQFRTCFFFLTLVSHKQIVASLASHTPNFPCRFLPRQCFSCYYWPRSGRPYRTQTGK